MAGVRVLSPTFQHRPGLRRFQAGMGWLQNHDFGVTSNDPWGPLGPCWVIIWTQWEYVYTHVAPIRPS